MNAPPQNVKFQGFAGAPHRFATTGGGSVETTIGGGVVIDVASGPIVALAVGTRLVAAHATQSTRMQSCAWASVTVPEQTREWRSLSRTSLLAEFAAPARGCGQRLSGSRGSPPSSSGMRWSSSYSA